MPRSNSPAMQSFLISRLSSLGDVVCTLPVAATLKAAFPEAHITWVVDKKFAAVVESCPAVDEVVILQSRLPTYTRPFDAALDMQGLAKSALAIARARAPLKLGYHWQREGARLFSSPVTPDPTSFHVVDQYVDVARAAIAELGARNSGLGAGEKVLGVRRSVLGVPDGLGTPITKDEGRKTNDDSLNNHPSIINHLAPPSEALQKLSPYAGSILLNPGAGWATKRWPPTHFAELIRLLQAQGHRTVLIGGPDTEEAAAEIIALQPTESLVGKTSLKELIAVISLSRAHVGGDTGSTHMAAAVGTRAIGLYSITNPRRSCPYGQIENCLYKPESLATIEPAEVFQVVTG